MISFDTETTGIDFKHGAKPFIATFCDEDGVNILYEWDVDPLTRKPDIPLEDLREIEKLFDEASELVLQNPKFDAAAMTAAGAKSKWPWKKTFDTLMAGHLLASNEPHDLTSMASMYLGIDIQPYEDAVKAASKAARQIAKRDYPSWKIAGPEVSEMPSVKGDGVKSDMWLPRAIAKERSLTEPSSDCLHEWKEDWTCQQCGGHRWWVVTADYANTDSAVTLSLFKAQRKLLKKKSLWKIYLERLKVLPAVRSIENNGITFNMKHVNELEELYTESSKKSERICVKLSEGYLTELSKGVTNSLRDTLFEKFKLTSSRVTKNGNPSLDKFVLDDWIITLPENSKALKFVKNLKAHRKRATALSFIEAYKNYCLPVPGLSDPDWRMIYSSLNPTGTDTLRFAAENPNSQQIGKQEIEEVAGEGGHSARYMFGPAPGREWWSLDAQNIELRIPAYEAGEEAMIELFERPNEPPYFGSNHLLFFSILHPDKWDRNDPHGLLKAKKKYAGSWYQWTKNGDFAIQYGAMASSGTADRAYHVPGGQLKIESHLAKIKKLSEKQIAYAEKHGYVETIPDKTVDPNRGYPLLCTKSSWGTVLPTVPLSYHVQGTAMWWMMKAMIRVQDYLDQLNVKRSGDYKMILQVHDELVFDFPKKVNQGSNDPNHKYWNLKIIREIQKLMEQGGNDIGIPTTVGCEYHPEHWGKGVTL